MRVLAYLAVRAEENSGQGTSFGLMTRSLALTEGRVRSACRALPCTSVFPCQPPTFTFTPAATVPM